MAESTDLMITDNELGNDMKNTDRNEEQKSGFMSALANIDVMRQVIIVLALAICLAIAVFIMLWAQEPEYRPLGRMETDQLIETLDFLDANKLDYKVEGNTVYVLEREISDIRLRMTRGGLEPVRTSTGDELILKEPGFGVSQRLEGERLKHAREQQLARTIEEMQSVATARVLLALPKDNVFTRRERPPTASVMIKSRRQQLSREEVESIVDLVASAVPQLKPSQVTVTDQNGRLLHSGSQNEMSAAARLEYEIERQREREFMDKIDTILSPVLGFGNYTAQVDVTMDFTQVEQTQRSYNPDLPAVRSEMIIEDNSVGGGMAGIPGALSNQPPLDSDIPEVATGGSNQSRTSGRNHREETRNYELDQTISHTRQQSGVLKRLSVSVALDHKRSVGAEGEAVRESYSAEELASIRRMLQGSLGFNINRGDSIEVVSFQFLETPSFDDVSMPWWEEPWVWRMLRLVVGGLVIIVLILTVVRPMLKKLIYPEDTGENELDQLLAYDQDLGDETIELLSQQFDTDSIGFAPDGTLKLPDLHKDEDLLKAVRALVANEPELSSQVVKAWLNEDA